MSQGDASPVEYAKLKVPELKALCKERGLSDKGVKADLIARLKEAGGAAPSPAKEVEAGGEQQKSTVMDSSPAKPEVPTAPAASSASSAAPAAPVESSPTVKRGAEEKSEAAAPVEAAPPAEKKAKPAPKPAPRLVPAPPEAGHAEKRKAESEDTKVPEKKSEEKSAEAAEQEKKAEAKKPAAEAPAKKRKQEEEAPREVPPSTRPPTNSLKIVGFVRPFTLPSLRELLEKTGKIQRFWMDAIKTHCLVQFTNEEEATQTRNAVHNLQWPVGINPKRLQADFCPQQEVEQALGLTGTVITKDAAAPQRVVAHVPVKAPALVPAPAPAPARNVTAAAAVPAAQPAPKKPEPKPLTLEDLFKKTTAKPVIYWLPKSEEQIEAERKKAEEGGKKSGAEDKKGDADDRKKSDEKK